MTDIADTSAAQKRAVRSADIVLGDDYVSPDALHETVERETAAKRGVLTLNTSPLARKIITFNLLGLIVLLAGILYLNPSRESLALQRATSLAAEAELVADVFEARLSAQAEGGNENIAGVGAEDTLRAMSLYRGTEVYVFDGSGNLLTVARGQS